MSDIFVSYRRADSENIASRIQDCLENAFSDLAPLALIAKEDTARQVFEIATTFEDTLLPQWRELEA
jgi:hypothetical protein